MKHLKLLILGVALAALASCGTLKDKFGIDLGLTPVSEAPAVTDYAAACSARAASVRVITIAVDLEYFDEKPDLFEKVDKAVLETRPYCSTEALAGILANPDTANAEVIAKIRGAVTEIVGAQIAAAVGLDAVGMSAAVTDQIAALVAAGLSVSELL